MRPTCLALFLLLTAIAFFACKKEKQIDTIHVSCNQRTTQLEKVKQLIAGSYNWAYTVVIARGADTKVETPGNTGSTQLYVFDTDGTVKYFQNNKLIWDRNYEVDYELRISKYYLDSAAFVIIKDKATQQRKEYFRAYLCNDSALFYNPYSSIDVIKNFKRVKR
jgi:hypothetical protein